MKKVFLILFLSGIMASAIAQTADKSETEKVARHFIGAADKNSDIGGCVYTFQHGKTLAYVYAVIPKGFVIIAADKQIAPIYAFSDESDFIPEDKKTQSLIKIITSDITSRTQFTVAESIEEKEKIHNAWNSLLKGNIPASEKAGWLLSTNWTQSAPYNGMCPMDLNAGSRSIAGCPAIAMGQIVNFNKKLNGIQFTNSDDYYHNYGTGNQYWIDNDWSARGFPYWDSLNVYLDSIAIRFSNAQNLNNTQMAALCFACGVAARQVYTASGSGTFGVDQAFDAYQRFGFTASKLVYPTDTSIVTQIRNNIISNLPVHLALVDSAVTVGHNVVVDGYNSSTDLYHFNFGWGGSNNGWYSLPPTTIAYNLTVIEGAVVDINLESVSVNSESNSGNTLLLFPNPANDEISFSMLVREGAYTITDATGRTVKKGICNGLRSKVTLSVKNLKNGIYFFTLSNRNFSATEKLIIQH